MPKRVDHEERRDRIAGALLRVISRDGLEAVSLRNVAAEAGVTAGMVQHYFSSKAEMMHFAMRTVSARYEERVTARLAQLGDDPSPQRVLETLLGMLIPAGDEEDVDGNVGLAFQAYAASHPDAADFLAEGNAALRGHIAGIIRAARGSAEGADAAATAVLAAAEGLGVHVLSSRLPASDARDALADLVALVLRG